jgi:signal transduction histidine kinase
MADPSIEDRLSKLRHDLSNPLAAILAETQLLLLNQEKFDGETVATLKQIEALARRMRDILQSLG